MKLAWQLWCGLVGLWHSLTHLGHRVTQLSVTSGDGAEWLVAVRCETCSRPGEPAILATSGGDE